MLLPAIEQGAVKAGRGSEAVQISATAFVVTSPEEDLFVRAQIAFYASTPSYRAVMALHGWDDVAEQLSALAGRGEWAEMPALITTEMLATFAVVANAADLPQALMARYQGAVDRLGLYLPFVPGERDEFWRALLRARA